MYCLQGNLHPFFKPFSIFCHWENKTHLTPLPSKKKKNHNNKRTLKKTKKAKKTKNLFKSMKVCVYCCVLVNSIRNKTGKNDTRKPKKYHTFWPNTDFSVNNSIRFCFIMMRHVLLYETPIWNY